MKIVETDNFGGDYPDEKVLPLPRMKAEEAQEICNLINRTFNRDGMRRRYWFVAEDDYKPLPGLEP